MKKHTTKKHKKSSKSSRSSSSVTKIPKVKIKHTQKNITSRGGLISVVGFMESMGYRKMFETISTFQRGTEATYTLFDTIFFSVIGYVSGVSTLSGIAALWKDRVLQKVSGYVQVPHETTLGRILGALRAPDIAEFEHFIHSVRKQVWTRSRTLLNQVELGQDQKVL